MNRDCRTSLQTIAAILILSATVMGQDFDVSWFTLDGGGAMNVSGAPFDLSGAAGQPDAGSSAAPMTGGDFALVGGFWPGATAVCASPGDMNLDMLRDGTDVQGFLDCLLGVSGSNCPCADVSGNGSVGDEDVPGFVSMLLGG